MKENRVYTTEVVIGICPHSLSNQSKPKQKKNLEVGHTKIVTHLQVGVTDLCLELLVTVTDSIKLSMISKIGILNKQKCRLSLG